MKHVKKKIKKKINNYYMYCCNLFVDMLIWFVALSVPHKHQSMNKRTPVDVTCSRVTSGVSNPPTCLISLTPPEIQDAINSWALPDVVCLQAGHHHGCLQAEQKASERQKVFTRRSCWSVAAFTSIRFLFLLLWGIKVNDLFYSTLI